MHFPVLIQDLAIILGLAALVSFIFRRIKQPVVLGYIVAGIIVGPYTPEIVSVKDTESIKVWAELGVIFLMFTLGLEFSFRRLARVGMSAVATATIQIAAMVALGLMVSNFLGWGRMDAIFLGCMIAISSTTIIIKALEEFGLKTRKFAELVFGILIVEDLAAILMLVGLTNVVTTSSFGGTQLLFAALKLGMVVGAWFVVGMFVVPRFVRTVARHGNDEMLTVVATGLCLALVALAGYLHYSLALGAFIMGSILAESSEAKRIEHLVKPVKDIFGAIFFVSVGMLLDPQTIFNNLVPIAAISGVIIVGKLSSVGFGAFLTGQTTKNSIHAAFSMAQIGEFSFIIATLGLSYGVISKELYPIIVASSLVTTFTTPYLIRSAPWFSEFLDRKMPRHLARMLDNYVVWVQRRSVSSENRKAMKRGAIKWLVHAAIMIAVFTVGADRLLPLAEKFFDHPYAAPSAVWFLALFLSTPSLWGMLSCFRELRPKVRAQWSLPGGGLQLVSRTLTIALLGILSSAYFPAVVTLVVTIVVYALVFLAFRRQIEAYYRWIESEFKSGFQADLQSSSNEHERALDRLAPWDAHLVELKVPARSLLVGKPLSELRLREIYGLNVVVIIRGTHNIVAPKASEILYPGDGLLCFATDAEIERFRKDIATVAVGDELASDLEGYDIRRLRLRPGAPIDGVTIRKSGIREGFDCIVVGLERAGRRVRSPGSELPLSPGDVLWVVGERAKLKRLEALFQVEEEAQQA